MRDHGADSQFSVLIDNMAKALKVPEGNQILGADLPLLDFDHDICPTSNVFCPFPIAFMKGDGLVDGGRHKVFEIIHFRSPFELSLLVQ